MGVEGAVVVVVVGEGGGQLEGQTNVTESSERTQQSF